MLANIPGPYRSSKTRLLLQQRFHLQIGNCYIIVAAIVRHFAILAFFNHDVNQLSNFLLIKYDPVVLDSVCQHLAEVRATEGGAKLDIVNM